MTAQSSKTKKLHLPKQDKIYGADINIHDQNLTDHTTTIAKECSPNKVTYKRHREPSWMTSGIKRMIRKRKLACREAINFNLPYQWPQSKQLKK